jgi:hypothetical protein
MITLTEATRAWIAGLLAAHTGNCVAMRGVITAVRDGLSALDESDQAPLTTLISRYDESCMNTHVIIDALRAAVEG